MRARRRETRGSVARRALDSAKVSAITGALVSLLLAAPRAALGQPVPGADVDPAAPERPAGGPDAAAPPTAARALAVARAAFEYRDFAQVVRALDPWVHPPRIGDPALMAEARLLLGVSHHVLGDLRAAREEFAQLLLLDPDRRLDPFIIPPQVIATFEEVRAQMGPVTPAQPRGAPPPSPRVEVRSVPHPAVVWLPLGVPQMALDETGTGLFLGALQVLGLALNVAAYLRADSFPSRDPPPEREIWDALQYGGLGVFGVAYGASVVHGHLLLEEQRRALAAPPSGSAARFTF